MILYIIWPFLFVFFHVYTCKHGEELFILKYKFEEVLKKVKIFRKYVYIAYNFHSFNFL